MDRLRDSREIAAVLRAGQRRAGRLVVIHARDQVPAVKRDSEPRVAVVASRKVGSAVARNRAKRLLREASRRVDWVPGTDLVLVARNACASSTMGAVVDELEHLAAELSVSRTAA